MKNKILIYIVCLLTFSACTSGAKKPQSSAPAPQALSQSANLSGLTDATLLEFENRADLKKKFLALSEKDRETSIQKSNATEAKARQALRKNDLKSAQELFEAAITANPTSETLTLGLGIVLAKRKDSLRSLAVLDLARGNDVNETERNYYVAVNYAELGASEEAVDIFNQVAEENDPRISPMAGMQAGMILRAQGQLDAAKAAFQAVLDSTRNKKIDRMAELQMNEVIAMQNGSNNKRFQLLARYGFGYDSNVLNVAASNTALNLNAYRNFFGLALDYQAINNESHHLVPRVSVSDAYSLSSKFKSEPTVQSTDPLQPEVALPYVYHSSSWEKSTELKLKLSYSRLYMSLASNDRKLVDQMTTLSSEFSTSHFSNWITNYGVDVASDKFELSQDELDQTGLSYGAHIENIKSLDSSGRTTYGFSLGALLNDAKGDDAGYTLYALGLKGTYPQGSKALYYAALDLNLQDFSKSSSDRSDKLATVSLGWIRALENGVTVNFTAQYNHNDSSLPDFTYNRFLILANASYAFAF